MKTTVSEAVAGRAIGKIMEKIETLKELVCAGQLESFEDYKSYCGQIIGLGDAVDLIQEAYTAIIKGED